MKRVEISTEEVMAARGGDKAATARIFAAMERLCWWVAAKRARKLPPSMSVEDAVQECRLGVMDAIRKYVPGRSNFAAYALIWMRARLIRNSLLEAVGPAPRSRNTSGGFNARPLVALDRPDEDTLAPIDTLADGSELPDAALAAHQERTKLRRTIGKLPNPQQRAIVWGRVEGRTLAEVGQQLGVSREYVRQVEQKALSQLRELLQEAA